MPKWKYIDKLETYDDRHQAFKNELDNLLARCFGENTYVEHKGDTVKIKIHKDNVKVTLEKINTMRRKEKIIL